MNRREFIASTTTAGVAASILPVLKAGELADHRAILATPAFFTVLRDERLVRDLGYRYCAVAPAQQSAAAVEQAILSDLPRCAEPLEVRIRARVRHDFATDRTVVLNGWILSVTEARQCALYVLTAA